MRKVLMLLAGGLLIASCTGDSSTTTVPFVPAPAETTTTPPATATSAPPTTTRPPTTTTAPASTTTAAPLDGTAVFAFTRISFGDSGFVEITNIGDGPGSLAGFWLCQRPGYFEIPAADLMPGDSLWVATGDGAALQGAVGLSVSAVAAANGALGEFTGGRGEIALYVDRDFSNPGSIRDFVAWAAVGAFPGLGRASVAVDADIWIAGDLVGVPPEATGLTAMSLPTRQAADWLAEVGG